jgi:hypothetical protein
MRGEVTLMIVGRVEAMEVREVLIKIGRMIQHQTRVGILNRHDGNPG